MQTLPTQIDFTKLAEQHGRLEGTLPLEPMSRLKELLANTDGVVTIHAYFNRDADHKPFLELNIETTVILECQRCLENFEYPLAIQVLLSPVFDPEAAKALQSYEPLLITKGELVNLQDMVEDEIMLNLPLVPKHPKKICPVVLSTPETNPVKSPFAVLSKLKIKKEE